MLTDIKVPVFPESVTDGVVATWHKRPGDAVRRDETLVEIETDKVMFEVPAPGDGTLSEVLQEEGATVAAGELLGRIEAGAGEGGEAGRRDGPGQASPSGPAAGGEAGPVSGPEAGSDASSDASSDVGSDADAGPDASPAARRLLSEHDLSAREVEGSGRDGRILKEDVLRAIDDADSSRAVAARRPAPAAGTTEAAPARAEPQGRGAPAGRSSPPAAASTVVEFPAEDRPQRRVQMTRLRARVAERLVQAQHTAAMLTTFNEVDMQPVMELRKRYRDAFEKAHGVRLGFMSFFVLASVEALKRFPMVNASIEGDDIVYHGFYDIGIAVASPRGLVVPVLRDADRLGVAAIEQRIADLAAKAQDGALSIDEITGGTFTITNGGVFGSLLSTPILNPPQSAILGMHRIEQRPVVVDGEIVARPMMYLALSYDHRLVDGREAVLFLATIRDLLQDPARLLLEV